MNILITGGAGFIGSHLAEALLDAGDDVTALDNLSTGSVENVAHLEGNPRFRLVVGDVQDRFLTDKLMERCDRVYHLAAAVGVELIVKKPWETLATNIRGTEVVLEMACRYRKKVLITSTSEIYGKNTNIPLGEEDDRILGSPLKSRWAYSTSKAVDEMLAYYYWKDRQLPAVIVRLFNTVGPRQTGAYGMVIPRFVGQALRDEPITVYGDGSQTRCFLHVRDCVSALRALMEQPRALGEVHNVGSEEEVSIARLAERVIARTGSRSVLTYLSYSQAYEEGFEDMQRRVPDTTKIRNLIGFRPSRTLDDILDDVIAHFRERGDRAADRPRS
ncbi:MAG: GDP-mannose 4,6-dehydratase [Acidobacteria bacterium]|nr:GDP-mannose 4,6-dehydratase [Acidobacteriota bacterium]